MRKKVLRTKVVSQAKNEIIRIELETRNQWMVGVGVGEIGEARDRVFRI